MAVEEGAEPTRIWSAGDNKIKRDLGLAYGKFCSFRDEEIPKGGEADVDIPASGTGDGGRDELDWKLAFSSMSTGFWAWSYCRNHKTLAGFKFLGAYSRLGDSN